MHGSFTRESLLGFRFITLREWVWRDSVVGVFASKLRFIARLPNAGARLAKRLLSATDTWPSCLFPALPVRFLDKKETVGQTIHMSFDFIKKNGP